MTSIACVSCGAQLDMLLYQVLELRAVRLVQCGCGHVEAVLKPPARPAATTVSEPD